MKKAVSALAITLGLFSFGALNADDVDVLALVSKGAVSSNSAGVKKLSFEEKKQVVGGYQVGYAYLQNFSFSSIQVKELAAIAIPDTFNEILSQGLCSLGQNSCYLSANTHYSINKDRYKELAFEADPLKGEYLAFSLKRTRSFANPYRPTLRYTTGAAVLGASNLGSIYKIRSANTSNPIVREMRNSLQNEMKKLMGL